MPQESMIKVKKKILIVDDEEEIRIFMKLSFERRGFECLTVEDGVQALAMTKNQHPDLIILDLMLPTISGEEVCREIKSDNALRSIPIIMLTAKQAHTDKILGRVYGADSYFTKPCDMKVLSKKVDELIGAEKKLYFHSAKDQGEYNTAIRPANSALAEHAVVVSYPKHDHWEGDCCIFSSDTGEKVYISTHLLSEIAHCPLGPGDIVIHSMSGEAIIKKAVREEIQKMV